MWQRHDGSSGPSRHPVLDALSLSPSDHSKSSHGCVLTAILPCVPPFPCSPAANATASTPVTAVLAMKAGEAAARAKAVPLQFHFHSHSEHLLDGRSRARVG